MKFGTFAPMAIIAIALILLSSCGGRSATGTAAAPAVSPGPGTGAPTDAPTTGVQPAVGTSTEGASAPATTAPATATAVPGSAVETPAGSAAPASPAGAAPARTPRKIGEIVYAEGTVKIHRGGTIFSGDIGSVVENLDVIATGPGGKAEIDLAAGFAGGAAIKLSENTAFYYETAALDSGSRETVLQLLAGSVALKVDKLSGGSFKVNADGAALGVRGTVFIVNTLPDGSMLVSCAEGKVECVSSDGAKAYAQPGTAVEKLDSGVTAVAIAVESLGGYRTGWVGDNTSAFEKRALFVISGYAERYAEGKPALNASLARLRAFDAVLRTWEGKKASGYEPRLTDWTTEKKQVGGVLFECLKALAAVERPYFRLVELAGWHARGIGKGSLKDGRATDAFFSSFTAEADSMASALSYVRRALYLFKYAAGDSPLGQFFGTKADSLGEVGAFLE
ncbi:MAG: FecR family protein [Spirochaetes bacterium]|nr:FecR family protein [Spirochaetota bacterium]